MLFYLFIYFVLLGRLVTKVVSAATKSTSLARESGSPCTGSKALARECMFGVGGCVFMETTMIATSRDNVNTACLCSGAFYIYSHSVITDYHVCLPYKGNSQENVSVQTYKYCTSFVIRPSFDLC